MIDNEARSSCGVNSKVNLRRQDEIVMTRARATIGQERWLDWTVDRQTDSATTQVCAQRQRQKTRDTIVDTTSSTTTRDEVTK